jgi:MFS family permease
VDNLQLLTMPKTNWQKNINAFLITTFFQWFYIPIGVWVLIWRQYFSWEQIGVITAIGLFVSLALDLPTGGLADLIGRKKTILFGRVIGIIGFFIMGVAHSFPLFAFGNALYLANWSFESGALSALLYDSLKENGQVKEHYQKTEASGFFYATLGMAVASIIGGYLYRFGPGVPYLATAIVAVAALISALFLEEPAREPIKVTLKSYWKQNWDGFRHIFSSPIIRAVSLFSVLINFVAYVGLWYLYEPRLAEGGFPAAWIGALVAGTYLIRAFGTKLIPLAMRLGDKYIPVFLALFQAMGSGLSFLTGRVGAISSVYTRKMADGFRQPILARLENDAIDTRYRATSLSAISMLGNILIASAGPFIGYFNEHYSVRATLGAFFFVGLTLVLPASILLSRQIRK